MIFEVTEPEATGTEEQETTEVDRLTEELLAVSRNVAPMVLMRRLVYDADHIQGKTHVGEEIS